MLVYTEVHTVKDSSTTGICIVLYCDSHLCPHQRQTGPDKSQPPAASRLQKNEDPEDGHIFPPPMGHLEGMEVGVVDGWAYISIIFPFFNYAKGDDVKMRKLVQFCLI